jgi:shikimate kinase
MFDLQGLNVYLIGMMGAGKSTIGKLLAERLKCEFRDTDTQVGYKFMDTDTSIEKIVGQSVTEIFNTAGEAEFRQLETQVLAEISAYTRLVVATGGGIAIKLENWNHLQQGLVIWLNVSVDVLVERLKNDSTRPILNTPGELRPKIEQILADRRDRYQAADLHIPITAHLPPAEIVDQILQAIPTVLKAKAQSVNVSNSTTRWARSIPPGAG